MSTTMTEATAAGDDLPSAIRREHAAASNAVRSALDHAMECGRLLAMARQGIAHGGWESFVRERCGIPERTARMYLRLDANRERLADRQRVAGLTVREAVRELTVPRVKAEPAATGGDAEGGDDPRLAVPSWYRPGHSHGGRHPSGWCFKVWPHPNGEPWAHYCVVSALSGYPGEEGGTIVGPKCGIRSDALIRSMEWQCAAGMPPLDDSGWEIGCLPVDAATIAAEPFYNSWLFDGDADYRRRGMGIEHRRKAHAGAPA